MKNSALIIFRRKGSVLFLLVCILFLPAFYTFSYLSFKNLQFDSVIILIFLTFASQSGWFSTFVFSQSIFGGEFHFFPIFFLVPQRLSKILFEKLFFSLILQALSSLSALVMIFLIEISETHRYYFISHIILAFFISPFYTIFNSLLNPYPLHTQWLKGMSYEGQFKKSLFGIAFLIIGPLIAIIFVLLEENINLWLCAFTILIVFFSGLLLKMRRNLVLLFYSKRFEMMEKLRPLN